MTRTEEVMRNTKRELVEALESAEAALGIWAEVLADAENDTGAAAALRTKSCLCQYRCDITP